MPTRAPFGIDEWYHCYGRGVDKRIIFLDSKDYERFMLSMHIGNGEQAVHLSNILKTKKYKDILQEHFQERSLVEIGAFCLMPNHFHLLLKEVSEGGISLFMQKVLTAYTMYFNKKYERSGALFANSFNAKHVQDDRYFKQVVSYIHLNPVEIEEKNWKKGFGNLRKIEKQLRDYKYSSLSSFIDTENPSNVLVSKSIFEMFDVLPTITQTIIDAQAYYQEHNIKV